MGAHRVLVTWPGFAMDDPETGGLLTAAGLEIVLAPKIDARSALEVRRLAKGAVAAIVSTDPFDRSVFEVARELRVVARVGVGTDSIDLGAATEAGVAVTTTPGANTQTTADHAVALMLAALRRVVEHDSSVRRGEWRRADDLTPWHLYGRTVGIVGFGEIGRAVAHRLAGFDTVRVVCDPAFSELDGLELVGLDELLHRSDVVSLHVPLNESTRGLIGDRELRLVGSCGILVNTSRGAVVDEQALTRALDAGDLRAAALDVFEDEPPPPGRLLELENVILSPHIGGLSVQSIATMTTHATRSVLDVLAGRPPNGLLNPAVLARGAAPEQARSIL